MVPKHFEFCYSNASLEQLWIVQGLFWLDVYEVFAHSLVIICVYQKELPFCMREIWVITACLTLVKATSQRFSASIVSQGTVKDFHRLQGDLYSYARTKVSLSLFLSFRCRTALVYMITLQSIKFIASFKTVNLSNFLDHVIVSSTFS